MRALVLGGSGHIGSAVVRELLGRGHEVTVACRRPPAPTSLDGLRVEVALGDDLDLEVLRSQVAGHELVVDAAAPYAPLNTFDLRPNPQRSRLARALPRVRVLCDAVRDQRARLVFVGSFVTRAAAVSPWSRWERALHPYFAVKKAMEEEVLRAARAGLEAVVVAPTACLGPWDLHRRDSGLLALLLQGRVPFTVNRFLNVIDVRDVARGIAAVVANERFGNTILLTGHNVTVEELAARLCELGGVARPRIAVPTAAAVAAAAAGDLGAAALGVDSPYPLLGVLLIRAAGWLPMSDAQRELGIYPRPLSETLADSVDWVLDADRVEAAAAGAA